MNKGGQVTLFIVLGIVISVVFLFVYLLESGYTERTKNLAKTFGLVNDKSAVMDFVSDCMEETGKDALLFIGMQGGYADPKDYAEYSGFKVSYGYYEKKNVLISQKELENEIGKYYEIFLPNCVNEIKGYNLEKGALNVSASISDALVSVNARYPISIVKGDSKIVVEPRHNVRHQIRLGKMRNIADDIVRKTFGRENIIDMAYLYDIGKDFDIQIANEADTRIYMLTDKRYELDNANYTFMFAEKF